MKRTAEERAQSAAYKRNAPIGIPEKREKIDMSALPCAPPAPRVREVKGMRNGLKTYGPLNKVNPERQAAKRLEAFGTHAGWVATLPCCVCMPEHYHAPLKPFLLNPDNRDSRISEPHHVRTRGAGGREDDCVPLCRRHHGEIERPGWGPATFEATYRVDLTAIALLLWENSPDRDK
jgi:hypothetical protein